MDHEKTIKQILFAFISIWAILLPPSILLALLTAYGLKGLVVLNSIVYQILFINSILFPFLIIISLIGNYLSIKDENYLQGFIFAFVPFINILIELIAADIALLLV